MSVHVGPPFLPATPSRKLSNLATCLNARDTLPIVLSCVVTTDLFFRDTAVADRFEQPPPDHRRPCSDQSAYPHARPGLAFAVDPMRFFTTTLGFRKLGAHERLSACQSFCA